MLNNNFFFKVLKSHGYDFITGIPCSLIEAPLNFLEREKIMKHVIATNEGDALAIAGGAYLAGRQPVIYLQNSGLGNLTNPLTSLHQLYDLPVLMLVTWRGRPDAPKEDAIEHKIMGAKTRDFFDFFNIPHEVLQGDPHALRGTVQRLTTVLGKTKRPVALLVPEGLFEPCIIARDNRYALSRSEAMSSILNDMAADSLVVSTTGMTSRELWTYRETHGMAHNNDFYIVGSMGCAAPLALGLAHESNRKVILLDGDGALLMRMGALSTIGAYKPTNLLHIVFDNEADASTGGQRTTSGCTRLADVAHACGYPYSCEVRDTADLERTIHEMQSRKELAMVVIKIKNGNLKDIGRVALAPSEITHNIYTNARE